MRQLEATFWSGVGGTCHDALVTAHGIPDDPQFATDSEREVWQRLLKQGHDDWTVLANVRLTDEKKDHELDLIVLMPTPAWSLSK